MTSFQRLGRELVTNESRERLLSLGVQEDLRGKKDSRGGKTELGKAGRVRRIERECVLHLTVPPKGGGGDEGKVAECNQNNKGGGTWWTGSTGPKIPFLGNPSKGGERRRGRSESVREV